MTNIQHEEHCGGCSDGGASCEETNISVLNGDHYQSYSNGSANNTTTTPTTTTTTTTTTTNSTNNKNGIEKSITLMANNAVVDTSRSVEKPPYQSTTITIDSNVSHSGSSCRYAKSWASKLHLVHLVLVVVSSAVINGIVFSVVNNFGLLYVALIDLFKSDTSMLMFIGSDESTAASAPMDNSTLPNDSFIPPLVAGIGSVNTGLIFFCSIFASVLSDRYGIRQVCFVGGILATIGMLASSVSVNIIYLYVTYGLVMGIGASLVYAPSLAILGHYFTKRLGLVNGLVTAGSSAFSIVMPIVLRWLLDNNGIQTTFTYLAGLMLLMVVCSLTFKEQLPKQNQIVALKRKNSGASLASYFFIEQLLKNQLYICWLISIPVGLFGYFVPFCHLVKHAKDINSLFPGEVLVMFISIFSLIGRLISGPLADFSHVNRIALQQIAFISIGFLTMSLTVVRGYALLVVCCGLGLFDGFFISLLGPIAFTLVGPEYANQAIGLLLCLCSLSLTCGPPIAAYAYSIYGNYKLAFFMAGIPPIVAAVLMFNIIRLQRKHQRSLEALTKVDNLDCNGFIQCENGEKLHLLSAPKLANSASNSTTGIPSVVSTAVTPKLRLGGSNSCDSGIEDNNSSTNSEHANLLTKSALTADNVIIAPGSTNSKPSSSNNRAVPISEESAFIIA